MVMLAGPVVMMFPIVLEKSHASNDSFDSSTTS